MSNPFPTCVACITLAMLTVLTACTDSAPPTAATPSTYGPDMTRADLRASATDLARAVARQLSDPVARAKLLAAMQHSPYRDWKVSWNAFTSEAGSGLLRGVTKDAVGLTANRRLTQTYRDLEMFIPVPEHRAQWEGGTNLIVTVYLDDRYGREGWVGFDLNGNQVKLSLDAPPATPVLVLLRPEGLIRRGQGLQFAECTEETCTGGGGGGSPPPPPPGYFMTEWQIDQSYESWTAGSPEFEIVAWHWTGQWTTTANGGHLPVLADNFFTCTSGDYPSPDPRDWYYNTPPDHNTAAQYGSTGIQILNGDEVYTFPPRPGYPILLVTENDDTPCIEGGFPTAWDPYFPDNNDELVGAAQLTSLNSVANVNFTGDDDFDTNPGVHAIMSFVRR